MTDVYIVFGTIPCLYACVNTLSSKNKYILYSRRKVINETFLEKNFKINYLQEYDCDFIKKDVENIIADLCKIDTKINLYTDDVRVQLLLPIVSNEILEKKIKKIYMISEGNITYDLFENWNKSIDNELKGLMKTTDIENILNLKSYPFSLIKEKKYCYLCPCLDKLRSEKKFQTNFLNYNFYDLDLKEKYLNLSKDTRYGMINEQMQKITKLKEQKLIVIGTYKIGDLKINDEIYIQLMKHYMEEYKNYKLFFKPHPLYSISKEDKLKIFLDENNIEIIGGSTPLELLIWNDDNTYVAGFCSSINHLISSDKTLELFGGKIGFSNYYKFNDYSTIEINQNLINDFNKDYYKMKLYLENKMNELEKKNNYTIELMRNKEDYLLKLMNEKEDFLIKLMNDKESNINNRVDKNLKCINLIMEKQNKKVNFKYKNILQKFLTFIKK